MSYRKMKWKTNPKKKKKKKKKKIKNKKLSPLYPIPRLPDELLFNCLARVSRPHYPTLSLVSKQFQSLLTSPDLYKDRSLLNHTESCLYVCLQLYPFNKSSWFTLCRIPNRILTKDKKKSSGYVLSEVPISDSPPVGPSSLVAVGSNIYNIGGSLNESSSSTVTYLDCRTHTWHEATSLRYEMWLHSASFYDEKIYVAGCHRYDDFPEQSFEVFDTRTQTWSPLSIECIKREGSMYPITAFIDGKFHITNGPLYHMRYGYMRPSSCCVIDNIMYGAYGGRFVWYDIKVGRWRKVEGLNLIGLAQSEKEPGQGCLGVADYAGKLAVLWERNWFSIGYGGEDHKRTIRCEVIALERRTNGEIWGNVEWSDDVLTLPKTSVFTKVVAVTL